LLQIKTILGHSFADQKSDDRASPYLHHSWYPTGFNRLTSFVQFSACFSPEVRR